MICKDPTQLFVFLTENNKISILDDIIKSFLTPVLLTILTNFLLNRWIPHKIQKKEVEFPEVIVLSIFKGSKIYDKVTIKMSDSTFYKIKFSKKEKSTNIFNRIDEWDIKNKILNEDTIVLIINNNQLSTKIIDYFTFEDGSNSILENNKYRLLEKNNSVFIALNRKECPKKLIIRSREYIWSYIINASTGLIIPETNPIHNEKKKRLIKKSKIES